MLLTLALLLNAIDIAVTDLHTYRHCHVCGLLACACGFHLIGADLIVEVNDLNEIIIDLEELATFLSARLAANAGDETNDVLKAVITVKLLRGE